MQRAIDILNDNNLDYNHIEKSKIGFMNSVFLAEKYVVKIYDNSYGFAKEKWFFENSDFEYAPKVLKIGENYLIQERIIGTGVYRIWCELDDLSRERIVEKIAKIVSRLVDIHVAAGNEVFEHHDSWQVYVGKSIQNAVKGLLEKQCISAELGNRVLKSVSSNIGVLENSPCCLCYNDLHFDNLLIDEKGEIYLIDFETLCIAPKDFILDTWDRMSKYPYIYANEDDHSSAKAEDYVNIVSWLRKYAPELFVFPQVEKRVALYGIMYDLYILFDYPNEPLVIQRIEENLGIIES